MTEFKQILENDKFTSKRDIVCFNGERPSAVNLEHVTIMYLEGNRITFEFYFKSQFVDFADEKEASRVFDMLINMWSSKIKSDQE